jgi:hypothetical protein
MTLFHAVMIGEDGMEFGVDQEAGTKEEARELIEENYPESSIAQLESPQDSRERESAMYAHIHSGGDWDDEGRPIFHHGCNGYDTEDDE